MDATTVRRPGRRGLCLVAGVLCALGIVCATTVVRATEGGHHPVRPASAAAAVLADGHGTSIRTVNDAVASSSAAAATLTRSTTSTVTAQRVDDVASVETVRTRGPPAIA